jgi:hypothetical protein
LKTRTAYLSRKGGIDMGNMGFRTDMCGVVTIVTPVLAEVAKQIFKEAGAEVRYEVDGEGTASREWMDMLGLANADKKILVSILPNEEAHTMAEKLGRSLPLKKAGNGIVFTLPAEKMRSFKQYQQYEEETEQHILDEAPGYLVSIIANKGCSEPVMEAARTVGATGGTVVHGEKVRHHALVRAWSLRHSETKEIILILSEASKTLGLMRAVTEQCGNDPQIQARAYASPVDLAFGLHYYLH